MKIAPIALITMVVVAAGCSGAETAASPKSPPSTGPSAPTPQPESRAEGPCALLTTAEVQRAFPGSKPGTIDRSEERHGVVSCLWDHPTGRFSVISGDTAQAVKDEAKGWTLMFLDPLRDDAARHVRYETLTGVGDEAIAIVERQDKTKGFLQNGAILVVRKGRRQVSAMSTELARRERDKALEIFAELGKAIAKRLE